MSFEGFTDETFRFLTELTLNNEKAWFEANRRRYEEHYLQPALAFIEALGPRLAAAVPGGVQYEARVNGSLFRVNRDIRFSKDKTPYKNHIDLWFWQGERKGWDSPGYWMRLLPDLLLLGAGMHGFSKPGLEAYRRAVLDDSLGAALEETVAAVKSAGPYAIGGASRKSVPRGYDASHPRAAFLLHEGLTADLETGIPEQASRSAFADYCLGHFQAMSPVNVWLDAVMRGVAAP